MAPEWREADQTFRPKELLEALPEDVQARLAEALDSCFVDLCKAHTSGVSVEMIVSRFVESNRAFACQCVALLGTDVLVLFLMSALGSAAKQGEISRVPASAATIQ